MSCLCDLCVMSCLCDLCVMSCLCDLLLTHVDNVCDDRLRDADGNVVTSHGGGGAYVPPGRRAISAAGDDQRQVILSRLKRQLKGQLNRCLFTG